MRKIELSVADIEKMADKAFQELVDANPGINELDKEIRLMLYEMFGAGYNIAFYDMTKLVQTQEPKFDITDEELN
jgi:hypothetical protein